jgi:hypothetical protein
MSKAIDFGQPPRDPSQRNLTELTALLAMLWN